MQMTAINASEGVHSVTMKGTLNTCALPIGTESITVHLTGRISSGRDINLVPTVRTIIVYVGMSRAMKARQSAAGVAVRIVAVNLQLTEAGLTRCINIQSDHYHASYLNDSFKCHI